MGLLREIVKIIFGVTSNPGASVTVPIGTGYSVANEQEKAVEKLTKLQEEAIAKFPPKGKETYCNFGLEYVAHGLGCHDLDNKNATCMVQHAKTLCIVMPQNWREDSWERAVAHAQKGGFAFVGIVAPPGGAHGHVASVAARPMELSGTWKMDVPILAQIGKAESQGFNKLSKCFLLSDKPMLKCFLWEPTNS